MAAHDHEHDFDNDVQQKGYVAATDFSLPYVSNHSRTHHEQRGMLRHVNCGYLSTRGKAPTLLALKQHAQSLALLIGQMSPSVKGGEINEPSRPQHDPVTWSYEKDDAFDFLTDLERPYDNDDPTHHRPLTSLMNEVKWKKDTHPTEYHCPLSELESRQMGQPRRPYANHHNLLMHGNACLEMLDHEFSATGGLLSILPTNEAHDTEQLAAARNSLVGQWLMYTQQLTGRMHEISLSYAQTLDALAGDSTVPYQLARQTDEQAATGRQVAYPQNRWILVNSGADVFQYLQKSFDRQEAVMDMAERAAREGGVSEERRWMQSKQGEDFYRGIVPLDISTRYYRLRGHGKESTIFVIPAYQHHPAVEYTRQLEDADKPQIVSVVQPRFPVRVSDLEARYQADADRAHEVGLENLKLHEKVLKLESELTIVADELEMKTAACEEMEMAVGSGPADYGLVRRSLEQRHQQEMRTLQAENTRLREENTTGGQRNDVLTTTVRAYEEQIDRLERQLVQLQAGGEAARRGDHVEPRDGARAEPSAGG